MKTIVVLAFPGNNCERETARALTAAGFAAKILRWNADPKEIKAADGVVVPGGFSFEDRGRSGVIAAKHPVINILRQMAADKKPILGICNGAQILVEAGLVPGFHPGKVEMALARNRRVGGGKILGSGFFHDTVFLKSSGKSAFTGFDGILTMPIAHGEGRFVADAETEAAIERNGQIVLKYCDADGVESADFPINPNGSFANAAAICNPDGNVVAMMPHPERSMDGGAIFASLRNFFAGRTKVPDITVIPDRSPTVEIIPKPSFSIEILVRLKITDTTEVTMESEARELLQSPDLALTRRVFWGIKTHDSPHTLVETLVASDEFFNEAKESVLVKISDEWFRVEGKQLKETDAFAPVFGFLAVEKDDILGQEKQETLKIHLGISGEVSSGIFWECSRKISPQDIAETNLFVNPVSGRLLIEEV